MVDKMVLVNVRVKESERTQWRKAAHKAEMNLSDYIRSRMSPQSIGEVDGVAVGGKVVPSDGTGLTSQVDSGTGSQRQPLREPPPKHKTEKKSTAKPPKDCECHGRGKCRACRTAGYQRP